MDDNIQEQGCIFSESLKESLESDSYQGFAEIMRERISENPEMLKSNEISTENVESIEVAFNTENFEDFSRVLGLIQFRRPCTQNKPCPQCIVKGVGERVSSYEEFKQILRNELL